MAKSARASVNKKNNQRLKRHVFGPVETARNERLNSKLLELASQPKPPRTEMEIEQNETRNAENSEAKNDQATEGTDVDMDADESNPTARSNNALKRQKANRSPRVEKKKRHRKMKNSIVFPVHPKKGKRVNKR